MKIFRYSDGALANIALLAYLLLGTLSVFYVLALDTESLPLVGVKIVAMLYLTHLLVLMAYLTHECMHNSLFKKPRHNDLLGKGLCWLLGANYLPYNDLKVKHLLHHSERQDVLVMDYREWMMRFPPLFSLVKKLQSWHFPAAELVTHFLAIAAPFMFVEKKSLRARVVVVAMTRIAFFLMLFWISPWLVVGFLVAQLGSMVVLGFMDAYQHTYEIIIARDRSSDKKAPRPSRDYEEQHTFTNLLSERFPLVNLLVLNFCYHNVHHWRSGEPWHRLPGLHKQRYPNGCAQFVTFAEQVKNFHTYRTVRIEPSHGVGGDATVSTTDDHHEKARAIGAAGVSFLVGV